MNLEKFTKDLAEQFEDADIEKITVDSDFKDLDGWDSLTMMLTIGMIKADYNVDITAPEIKERNTVKDLFEYIINK